MFFTKDARDIALPFVAHRHIRWIFLRSQTGRAISYQNAVHVR